MGTIGIDFGTSGIQLAAWSENGIKVLPDVSGKKRCPGYIVVDLKNSEITYGEEARALSTVNTDQSIYDIKQFLGADTSEARRIIATQLYPFTIEAGTGQNVNPGGIVFKLPGGQSVSVVEAARLLFVQARLRAGPDLAGCFVTRPGNWAASDDPKNSLLSAALKLLREEFTHVGLADSSLAAVMGCFLKSLDPVSFSKNVIVIEVGANNVCGNFFKTDDRGLSETHSAGTLSDCGGNAVDLALLKHCCGGRFSNVTNDLNAVHLLRLECEDAKIRMTAARSTLITVPNLCGVEDFSYRLNDAEFQALTAPFAAKIVDFLSGIVRRFSLKDKDYQILLLGGASRLPALRRRVKDEFGDRVNVSDSLYPDEVTAIGVAGIAKMFDMVPQLSQIALSVHYRPLCKIFRTYGGESKNEILSYLSGLLSSLGSKTRADILEVRVKRMEPTRKIPANAELPGLHLRNKQDMDGSQSTESRMPAVAPASVNVPAGRLVAPFSPASSIPLSAGQASSDTSFPVTVPGTRVQDASVSITIDQQFQEFASSRPAHPKKNPWDQDEGRVILPKSTHHNPGQDGDFHRNEGPTVVREDLPSYSAIDWSMSRDTRPPDAPLRQPASGHERHTSVPADRLTDIKRITQQLRLSENSVNILKKENFVTAEDFQSLSVKDIEALDLPRRDAMVIKKYLGLAAPRHKGPEKGTAQLSPPPLLGLSERSVKSLNKENFFTAEDLQYLSVEDIDALDLSLKDSLVIKKHLGLSAPRSTGPEQFIAPVPAPRFAEEQVDNGRSANGHRMNESTVSGPVERKKFAPGSYKILLLGETGAGKSTLINYFANFFLDGDLDRLKIVIHTKHYLATERGYKSTEKNLDDSTLSKTSDCSYYDFVKGRSAFQFIDTPGLSDTSGSRQDDSNTEKIMEAARTAEKISGIMIVINGSVARATANLRNTLRRMSGAIPDVLLKNLLVVLTNCTRAAYNFELSSLEPWVIPEENVFFMQNLALSRNSEQWRYEERLRAEVYRQWEESMNEIQMVVERVTELGQTSTDVFKTMQEKRGEIKAELSGIFLEIRRLQTAQDQLEGAEKALANVAGNIIKFKNYRQLKEIVSSIMVDAVDYSTMCQKHQTELLCHENCSLAETTTVGDQIFRNCFAFGNGADCRICGCSYLSHYHAKKKIETVKETVEDILEDVKAQFELNTNRQASLAQDIGVFQADMQTLNIALKSKQGRIRDCCAQLNSICKGFNFVAEMQANIDMMEADARTLTSLKTRKAADDMIRNIKELIDRFSDGSAAGQHSPLISRASSRPATGKANSGGTINRPKERKSLGKMITSLF